MRPRSEAGHTDVGDALTLSHLLAGVGTGGEAREMPVDREHAARVLDLDDVAIAAHDPGETDAAITRRVDRRADRGRVVNALMGTDTIQDRVHARGVEARADARELDGRAQEG